MSCFAGALLLVRIVELRTKRTWSQVRDELQRMHLGEFLADDHRCCSAPK